MNNNIITTILALLFSLNLSAQDIRSESRTMDFFNKIRASSIVKVEIHKGSYQKIDITTENVSLKKVTSEIINNELVLDLKNAHNKGKLSMSVTVKVYLNDLESIEGSIASSFKGMNRFEFEEFTIDLGEASRCELEMDVTKLNLILNSASRATLSGNCEQMDACVNSASSLYAYDMPTKIADLKVSSAGKAKVNVSQDLEIDASSMAKVFYMGDPEHISKDKSSMASIKQVDEKMKLIK